MGEEVKAEIVESKGQYLIVIQKVTSLSGESIQVSTNLPRSSTKEEMLDEFRKILWAMEERLVEQNEKVIAITEATRLALDGLGVGDDKVN